MTEKLTQAKQLYNRGKYSNALKKLDFCHDKLPFEEQFECRLLKIKILNKSSKHKKAINQAKILFTEINITDNPLRGTDVLVEQAEGLLRLGKLDESHSVIKLGEKIVRSTIEKDDDRKAIRIASLLHTKGLIFDFMGKLDLSQSFYEQSLMLQNGLERPNKHDIATTMNNLGTNHHLKGNLEKALQYYHLSISIWKEFDYYPISAAYAINNIGDIYRLKGDLNQALIYYKQSLKLKRHYGNKQAIATSLHNIGNIHHQKGELDKARVSLERALKICEDLGNQIDTSETLFHLCVVTIDNGTIDRAKSYEQHLSEIDTTEENKVVNIRSRLARAYVLKSDKRQRKKFQALDIFEQVIREECVDIELQRFALLNLCDLLLYELKNTGSEEVLAEVKQAVANLLELAKKQNSQSLLAETYWLKARLSLLEWDIDQAKQLFSRSFAIANSEGLKHLAIKISNSHDTMLESIAKLGKIINSEMSLSQRLELIELEDMVVRLINKRVEDFTELPEEPVLLVIMTNDGITIYSKVFDINIQEDVQLLGGFLTAINAFSTATFAVTGSIERIKHQAYTMLIKSEDPVILCYVFKGQSYAAQKKFTDFIHTLKSRSLYWKILVNAVKEFEVLTGKNLALIDELVEKIIL